MVFGAHPFLRRPVLAAVILGLGVAGASEALAVVVLRVPGFRVYEGFIRGLGV